MLKIFKQVAAGCIIAAFFCSCSGTGSNALPQASLPAPTECDEGCIVVSSPDSSGFVTISGSAGVVPDSAIVLVEIEAGSSSRLFYKMLDGIIAVSMIALAHAAECSSDAPLCSGVAAGFSGTCQLTAAEDGSFVIRIPAGLEDTLKVSYLDPEDACEEVARLDQKVSDAVSNRYLALSVEAVGMVQDGSNIYAFGADGEAANKMITINISDLDNPTASDPVAISLSGAPQSMPLLFEFGDTFIAAMTTSEQAALVDVNNVVSLSDIAQLTPGEGSLIAERAFINKEFTYPDANSGDSSIDNEFFSCPEEAEVKNLWGTTVDRILFSRTIAATSEADSFHPIAVLDAVPASLGESLRVRPISYASVFFHDVDPAAEITEVVDLVLLPDATKGFFLGKFDISGVSRFYLVEVPLDTVFCSGMIATGEEVVVVPLPEDLQEPGRITTFELDNVGHFLIPDQATAVFYVVNLSTEVVQAITPITLSESQLAGSQIFFPGTLPGDKSGFLGVGSDTFLQILELDTSAGLGDLGLTELTSTFFVGLNPQIMITMDNPTNIGLTTDNATLVILDQGIAADGSSQILLIPQEDLLAE